MAGNVEYVFKTDETPLSVNLDPTSNNTLDAARSGTELLRGRLFRDLNQELLQKIQIIVPARLDGIQLTDRPKVLWLHDLATDPAVAHLADPLSASQFNLVCVSHWQHQQYLAQFPHLKPENVVTIKNGIDPIPFPTERPKQNGRWQLVYTPTPHRGLGVLVAAIQMLAEKRQDFDLHVCSSFDIYGPAWAKAAEHYAGLFDVCKSHPRIVYHGTLPHDDIQQLLPQMHLFAYPSIYPETSCLCAIEAMAAGCVTLTTPLGALPETCGQFGHFLPLVNQTRESLDILVHATMHGIDSLLEKMDAHYDQMQPWLRLQSHYFNMTYDWSDRVRNWTTYLGHLVNRPVEQKEQK